ncbi:MAG: hypothetical protein GQ477_04935 [Nanohaloarchaea archaeon]|nr:hypothetical protein [Candidatus Nanohaloarchaea archaeon]
MDVSKDEFRAAIKQKRIEDKQRVLKYTDFLREDMIKIIGRDWTHDLEESKYMTYKEIYNSLKSILESEEYPDECRDRIGYYFEDIIDKMISDKQLESEWFPYNGNHEYPKEIAYRLTKEGIDLLKSYLDEKN